MVGGAAIDVRKSDTSGKKIGVTIENCSFENNVITGGSGSAIHLFVEDCDMTIKDSTFTGNHAGSVESDDDGGVICAYSGSLVLDGCTITGNTAAAEPNNNHCGGVSVSKDVKSFIIKGKTVIKDNTCGGESADLCLQDNGAKFKVEDLNPESKIGVMAVYDIEKGASAVIGENATDDDLQYFFADNTDYSLKCEDSKLILTNGAKKPDPKKEESSSDTYSLFTGTWGNPVSNGNWTQDANGVWHYSTTATFRNTWGYIKNPYAKPGQHEADWFYFDNAGNMLTGWQFIQGKWYYLNPTKDGTLGACQIGGVTPDGHRVDENGAWDGKGKAPVATGGKTVFTGTAGNPVVDGNWSLDANGVWHYTTSEPFKNTWAYIYNPYAYPYQHSSDWFYFDEKGNMLTGWQLIQGKWYYLHPNKDGVLGSCLMGPATTPDGYKVDATGARVN